MLAANEIKVEGNELVQILTLSKKEISDLKDPFGCATSASPLFTYPFFGEQQIVSLSIPSGTSEIVLDSLEIVVCVCNELVESGACYLGVNDESILGEARGKIELKLKEMTSNVGANIEFYHSWSDFQNALYHSDTINGFQLIDCATTSEDNSIVKLLSNNSTFMSRGRYYNCLQLLLPFYIEAATPIDTSDSKWSIYLQLGDSQSVVTGLLTAYNYFKYPEGTRVRISQVVVFPRYQGKRLGSELYRMVAESLRGEGSECVEICVEDPTDAFERIRGLVDYKECLKSGVFKDCDIVMMTKMMKFTPEHCERLCLLHKSLRNSDVKRPKLSNNTSLRQEIKRWLLKKYRKDLPEGAGERIEKLKELYEGEMDEFIEPLIGILKD